MSFVEISLKKACCEHNLWIAPLHKVFFKCVNVLFKCFD